MPKKYSSPLVPKKKSSHEKAPASHRARGETPTISLALGANREGKGSVKRQASRIHSSRISLALVCVRWNAQHHELKLPESTRLVVISVAMVAVSPNVPIGYLSPPLLSTQNIKSHETSPSSHRARGETKSISLALGANSEGKERVKCKAIRIQCTRIGSELVYVRRNAKQLELNLPDYVRFMVINVVMAAVSTCGPTDCLVIPGDMSVEIARRTRACWMRIRQYLQELYDHPKVALSLKTRMVKAEATEALLYGCST